MNEKVVPAPSADRLMCDTISFLRFPLMVCVVFIHTNLYEFMPAVTSPAQGAWPVYDVCSYVLSTSLCSIAVPAFFLFSGYLFFRSPSAFTLQTYGEKLKRRTKSLLIPYLAWNLLMLAALFLQQTLLPALSGHRTLVSDYTLTDWLYSFWNASAIEGGTGSPFPACPQFWFIRDLMVVIVCSPLVELWVRKLRLAGILLLVATFLTGFWPDWVGFGNRAFCFFTLGAYFSISGNLPLLGAQRWRYAALAAFCLFTAFGYLQPASVWSGGVYGAKVLAGLVMGLGFVSQYLQKHPHRLTAFWAESSFFVFGAHYLLLTLLLKLCFSAVTIESDFGLLALYLLAPCAVIALCVGLYALLAGALPRVSRVFTGWR